MARLQRTLSLGAVVLFGIAYMTPTVVLATFGIAFDVAGARPLTVWDSCRADLMNEKVWMRLGYIM